MRAGTKKTSPVSAQRLATSADSAGLDRRPTSSTSQDRAVPAESIIASTPHVRDSFALPGDDREAALFAALAESAEGRRGRRRYSHPGRPPCRTLLWRRQDRTQPWPISEACWSPTKPTDGRGARPERWLRRLHLTRHQRRACRPAGIRNLSRRAGSQTSSALPASTPSVGRRPLTPALLGSVMCARPPVRCHTAQVSSVPKRRSRLALGVIGVEEPGQLGCRLVGRQAQAFGLELETGPGGAQILPAERRADRFAGGGVPDDGGPRWLVTPTPVTWPDLVEGGARHLQSLRFARAAPSKLDQPGEGVLGGSARPGAWPRRPRRGGPRSPLPRCCLCR